MQAQTQQNAEIIIDDREPNELLELLINKGTNSKKARLILSDILIAGNIAIERKARSDLENSITDGRLFSQLSELRENFSTVILVIEGTEKFERINRNALIAALSSAALENISLFFTRNIEETAELIYWLSRKSIDRNNPKSLIAKKPRTERDFAIAIYQTLPGVSIKIAENLAMHFPTVKELANASVEDLEKVEKIGKKKALKIYNILNMNLRE